MPSISLYDNTACLLSSQLVVVSNYMRIDSISSLVATSEASSNTKNDSIERGRRIERWRRFGEELLEKDRYRASDRR